MSYSNSLIEQGSDWYSSVIAAPPEQRRDWYSAVAVAYDRTRPRYPSELIQQAIALAQLPNGAKILEIGCGPGIATVEFAKLGFSVVSLEPSAAACQIARDNCAAYPQVEIVNTTFEDWELGTAKFSAILAATSWHWVDPKIGYPKAIASLADQGYLILLWNNIPQPSPIVCQQLQPVYAELAPALGRYEDQSTQEKSLQNLGQKVMDSGLFKNFVTTQQVSQVTYSIDNYLTLLSTLSPYIALAPNQREQLFAGLQEVLTINYGDTIATSYLSMLQIAQKI
jgi:SAM-dependent methyltransferase